MARVAGRICPKCGGAKSYYSPVCTHCKDWRQQPANPPGSRAIKAARVHELLDAGWTMKAIAQELGIAYQYVSELKRNPTRQRPRVRKHVQTEASVANRKRYREHHRDEIAAAAAEWQRTSPKWRRYAAAYREAHREKAAAATRAWSKANPERKRWNDERRRARIVNAAVVDDVDRAAIIARDSSTCHLCGKKVRPKDMSLDHLVPLSKGGDHTAANLAVAHRVCNSKRHDGCLPAQLRLIG